MKLKKKKIKQNKTKLNVLNIILKKKVHTYVLLKSVGISNNMSYVLDFEWIFR